MTGFAEIIWLESSRPSRRSSPRWRRPSGFRKAQGVEAALAVVRSDRGMAIMRDLRERIGAMTAGEEALRKLRQAGLESAITWTIVAFSLVTFLGLALLFVVHHFSERGRRELKASVRWFSTTLASIGDAVVATDETGRVTFMNPTAEKLTGWTQAEAWGLPLDAVFRISNEETGEPVESPVEKVLRDGNAVGLAKSYRAQGEGWNDATHRRRRRTHQGR